MVALPSSLAHMSFHNFEGFEKKKRVWKTRSRAEYFREYRQKKKEIEKERSKNKNHMEAFPFERSRIDLGVKPNVIRSKIERVL